MRVFAVVPTYHEGLALAQVEQAVNAGVDGIYLANTQLDPRISQRPDPDNARLLSVFNRADAETPGQYIGVNVQAPAEASAVLRHLYHCLGSSSLQRMPNALWLNEGRVSGSGAALDLIRSQPVFVGMRYLSGVAFKQTVTPLDARRQTEARLRHVHTIVASGGSKGHMPTAQSLEAMRQVAGHLAVATRMTVKKLPGYQPYIDELLLLDVGAHKNDDLATLVKEAHDMEPAA